MIPHSNAMGASSPSFSPAVTATAQTSSNTDQIASYDKTTQHHDTETSGLSLPSPAGLVSRTILTQSNNQSVSQTSLNSPSDVTSPVNEQSSNLSSSQHISSSNGQSVSDSIKQLSDSPNYLDLVSERSLSDRTHTRTLSQSVDTEDRQDSLTSQSTSQSNTRNNDAPSSPLSQPRSNLRHSLPMFRNQVAGHSPLFWHSGTICKPLIEQEYRFYADLEYEHPDFMRFVPKFYGVMDLDRLTEEMANSIQQSSGGNEWESGNQDESNTTTQQSKDDLSLPELKRSQSQNETSSDVDSRTQQSNNHLHKQSNSGEDWTAATRSRGGSKTPPDTETTDQTTAVTNTQSNTQPISQTADAPADEQSVEKAMNHNNRLYNKWSMKCQLRKGSTRPMLQYIVLEDLSFAYSKPCILDLKIGTRQHSDDERPSKIASKTARCLHTTSAALGLRLCGMQVYNADTQRYLFRDKYWGRSLDETTFKQAIKQFFWDGSRYLLPIIKTIRKRIETLNQSINQSAQGRKFYSSSLLLIYEGDPACRSSPKSSSNPSLPRHGSDVTLFSPLNSPQEKRTMSAVTRSLSQSINQSSHPFISQSQQSNIQSNNPTSKALLDELNEASLSSSVPKNQHSDLLDKQMNHQSTSQSVDHRHSSLPAGFSMSSAVSNSSNDSNNQKQCQSVLTSPSQSTHTLNQSINPSTSLTMNQTINQIIPASVLPPSPRPLKLYVKKRKTTHAQAMAQSRARGNVDVRIIDFAHTSRAVDGTRAQEMDTSLLFGFASLIRILKQVEHEVDQEERGQIAEVEEEELTIAGELTAAPVAGD